jgi:hypothetical protein
MSYYISANGKVHCSGVNGLEDKPFTNVLEVKTNGITSINETDTGGGSPSSYFVFRNDQIYISPYIVIKDGSKKIYHPEYFSSCAGMITANQGEFNKDYDLPWMFNASISSRNNQYNIHVTNLGSYGLDYYYLQQWKNILQKEVYLGDKPIVNFIDRDKGNVLSWTLSNEGEGLNAYWFDKRGPYIEDITNKADPLLRGNNASVNPGNLSTNSNTNASYMKTDIGYNSDSLPNAFSSNIVNIRKAPNHIQNNKFGFTPHYEDCNTFNSTYPISYFTLNVNDIKQQGYSKIKLKYFYNILFDGEYSTVNQGETNPDFEVYHPYAMTSTTSEWDFTNRTIDNHPFIFNYCLSDNTIWDGRDDETYSGVLIAFSPEAYNDKPINMKSSIEVTENDGHLTYKALDIDNHKMYSWCPVRHDEDPWNDVETYKRLYLMACNTGETGSYAYIWKYTTIKGTNYTKQNLDDSSFKTWTQSFYANTESPGYRGVLFKYNNRYFISNHNMCKYHNVEPAGTGIATEASGPWIELKNIQKFSLTSENKYNSKFCSNNKSSGFLLDETYDSWKSYTANWVPYQRTYTNELNNFDGYSQTAYDNTNIFIDYWGFNPNVQNSNSIKYGLQLHGEYLWRKFNNFPSEAYLNFDKNNKYSTNNIFYTKHNNDEIRCKWKLPYSGCYAYDFTPTTDCYYYYSASHDNQYFRKATYNSQQGTWSTANIGTTFNNINLNAHCSYSYITEYNKDSTYKMYDVVKSDGKYYQTFKEIVNTGTNELDKKIEWNPKAYDITLSREMIFSYKNYGCVGSSEFIIDLENEYSQYLHIMQPSTTLLGDGLFDYSKCNVFITDLKMTYEGVE